MTTAAPHEPLARVAPGGVRVDGAAIDGISTAGIPPESSPADSVLPDSIDADSFSPEAVPAGGVAPAGDVPGASGSERPAPSAPPESMARERVNPVEAPAVAGLRGSPVAADWVSRELHREALERFVPRGSRVLLASPAAGPFIEVLHQLGCKLSVCSGSPEEQEPCRAQAEARGHGGSVEHWLSHDLAALDGIADAGYDVVVAYCSALSFALERRDRVLAGCLRVLRPRGVLVLSEPSLWGTLHRGLPAILRRDLVQNRAIIRSGNAPESLPGSAQPFSVPSPAAATGGRQRHLFRAAELEAFLRRAGLELLSLSASSALSTGVDLPTNGDPSEWSALLEYERAACVERGYLDSGTHLIAVARR